MPTWKEGGWAFPRPAVQGVRSAEDNEPAVPGMTLRDYFAAAVLTGICSVPDYTDTSSADVVARDAYRMADAMLKAREAKP